MAKPRNFRRREILCRACFHTHLSAKVRIQDIYADMSFHSFSKSRTPSQGEVIKQVTIMRLQATRQRSQRLHLRRCGGGGCTNANSTRPQVRHAPNGLERPSLANTTVFTPNLQEFIRAVTGSTFFANYTYHSHPNPKLSQVANKRAHPRPKTTGLLLTRLRRAI